MATPFKMKGSPMARNFGISPMKNDKNKNDKGKNNELINTNDVDAMAREGWTPKEGGGYKYTGKNNKKKKFTSKKGNKTDGRAPKYGGNIGF